MLRIFILICPIAVDHLHCDRDTAIDTIRGSTVSSAQQCAFLSQAMIAPTVLVQDPKREYVVVRCPRDGASASN